MAYFTEAYNDFFKGLAANNHKEWFHENKKTYESAVKKPFNNFLIDLIACIKEEFRPNLTLAPKHAKFRINRDLRFNKNRPPYKLHMGAVISDKGRKDMQIPGLYVQLGVGEIWIGGGSYKPSRDNLLLIRRHISKHLEEVEQLLADKTFQHYYPKGIEGDKHKRIPKEFKTVVEKQPLIAHKQLYFMATHDDEQLILREDFMDIVLAHYRAAQPWNNFLEAAMQAS